MLKKDNLKEKFINDKVKELNSDLSKINVSKSLNENVNIMKTLFKDDDIFIMREIRNNDNKHLSFVLTYSNGLVDPIIVNENIIKPLMLIGDIDKKDIVDYLEKNVLQICELKRTDKYSDIVKDVTYGDVVLFIENSSEALILNTKFFEKRYIIEPENEKNLAGPREGFTEILITNLSLIRRKLRTNKLKFKCMTLGDISNTQACICYIDGIVNKDVLLEVERRLSKIKIDGVLDTNYITELIRDNKWSPFRTTGYTERPDVAVGRILEGRILIILDGSPMVMTVPYLFIENFESSEDYYLNFYYTTFSRIMRVLGFVLSILVPAFFIAIVVYHKEMLPTPLFINIAIERNSSPLPAAVEAFIMLIVFDIIKETGVRMPNNIGQTLSIVGAIVIGQAAVEAKLVAAPMIIVVAFTGITSLLIPKLNAPVIVFRYLLLILASALGLFGVIIGLSLILVQILNLTSFGIPEVNVSNKFRFQAIKDIFFRAPWWKMNKRPKELSSNITRQGN